MDPLRSRQLAEAFIPRDDQKLDAAGGRIDPAAIQAIDADGDARIDREELQRGLEQDRVNVDVSGTAIIDANTVAFPEMTGPLGPNGRPEDGPWFRGGMVAGGQSATPPRPASAWQSGHSLTEDDFLALGSMGFAETAAKVRTPADAAVYLEARFRYDEERFAKGTGPASAWSSAEAIALQAGVCRDQHAVARDLLLANGTRAEMVGYQSANHSHAVTAYQDAATGYWGIIEYGTLYDPQTLQANSPEEAVAKFRPNALAIERYSSDGPDERSWTGAVQYTALYRSYTDFMTGPAPGAGSGVQVDRTGISLTAAGPAESHLQAQAKMFTDPTQPQLAGAMMAGIWQSYPDAGGYTRVGLGGGFSPGATSPTIGSNVESPNPTSHFFIRLEERHPALLRVPDVFGTGASADLRTRTVANLVDFGAVTGESAGLGKLMLANLTVNPEVGISRSFAIGGGQPDLQVRLAGGLGFDKVQAHMLALGVSNTPQLSSYGTITVNARPLTWLGIQVSGYMPVGNATNDFLATPAVRATVATPAATLSTTQSAERATYTAQVGTTLAGSPVTAYASLDEDRRSRQTSGNIGIQASVATW
jgi:hypothetical protein